MIDEIDWCVNKYILKFNQLIIRYQLDSKKNNCCILTLERIVDIFINSL